MSKASDKAAQDARERAQGWHNVMGATSEELRFAEAEALKRYGDIIDLPAPTSKRHPRQPPEVRAAQFSPFAALTGYGEQVSEEGRPVESQRELAEDEREAIRLSLNEMAILVEQGKTPAIRVTYFVPDPSKNGGQYTTVRGQAIKIDEYRHSLVIACENAENAQANLRLEIPLSDIWQLAFES